MAADPAAADDQHLPHALLADAQIAQQLIQVRGLGDEKYVVAFLKHEVSGGDGHFLAAQHGSDEDFNADSVLQAVKYHAAQWAFFIHAHFDDFHAAFGKGVAFEEVGKLQDVKDFAGSGIFRVDGHGKPQLFAKGYQLLGIFGVANAGDGVGRT